MKRLLPQSLRGQVLLAVAVALLIAQAISAALALEANAERREAATASYLAITYYGTFAREGLSEGERAERSSRRRGPRRPRAHRVAETPLRANDRRIGAVEDRLGDALARQDVPIRSITVISRDREDTPRVLGRRAFGPPHRFGRATFGSPDTPEPVRKVAVAVIEREDRPGYWIAQAPLYPMSTRFVALLIGQTLLIYLALFAALAFVLRRITRPLAALTGRVEQFAANPTAGAEPIAPVGPADTRRLISAHNRMESRIGAMLDEKDVMLGAIGHDLRTPLAALRVRIESVSDEAQRARMADTIDDITRTLDDILSLARVGRASDPVEPVELSSLVADLVAEYEDMGQPVTLTEAPRVTVNARATWLRRAIRNLVDNALRYGKVARVSLEGRDGGAAIIVEDDGPGIPEDQIAAMLEPFARGEKSRNRTTGGAGLGLTLARAIAEQHGGELRLTNPAGHGLRAEIAIAT